MWSRRLPNNALTLVGLRMGIPEVRGYLKNEQASLQTRSWPHLLDESPYRKSKPQKPGSSRFNEDYQLDAQACLLALSLHKTPEVVTLALFFLFA